MLPLMRAKSPFTSVMVSILEIKNMIFILASIWHAVSDEYAVPGIPSVSIFKF